MMRSRDGKRLTSIDSKSPRSWSRSMSALPSSTIRSPDLKSIRAGVWACATLVQATSGRNIRMRRTMIKLRSNRSGMDVHRRRGERDQGDRSAACSGPRRSTPRSRRFTPSPAASPERRTAADPASYRIGLNDLQLQGPAGQAFDIEDARFKMQDSENRRSWSRHVFLHFECLNLASRKVQVAGRQNRRRQSWSCHGFLHFECLNLASNIASETRPFKPISYRSVIGNPSPRSSGPSG